MLLVIGFRKELLKVIEARSLAYVLWVEKRYKKITSFQPKKVIVAPHYQTPQRVSKLLKLNKVKSVTHVIAGTESSVVTAYFARRFLNARINRKALVERCTDKLLMKSFLKSNKIPMTDFQAIKESTKVEQLAVKLKLPIVVKDRKNSGGRGTIISSDKKVIKEHIKRTKLAEKFVNAPEASIETLIHDSKIIFTNITQYYKKGCINLVPAHFTQQESFKILDFNSKVLNILKIKWGMTHLEIYRSKHGPLFGEIALRPPGGYLMDLITLTYGFNSWEAFLDIELGVFPTTFNKPKHYTSSVILYPGEGVIRKITGWGSCRKIPGFVSGKLKAYRGQKLKPREAVSNESAHIILMARSEKQLKQRIKKVLSQLKFSLK